MKLTISTENTTQSEILLTLPTELLKDLRKIESLNSSGLEAGEFLI